MVAENYSLSNHNTFHLKATARLFAEYNSVEELCEILSEYSCKRILHIGRGSNLLFTCDFDGLILHSAIVYIDKIKEDNNYVYFKVGAGVVFDDFVNYAVIQHLGGIENLSYIPGEVGASAVQNIGAYGVEVKDVIQSVDTIEIATLQHRVFDVAECKYGYRDSVFKNELKDKYVVTSVTFRLDKQPHLQLDYGNVRQSLQEIKNPTLLDVRQAITNIRKQKLPEVDELGSAGSFFKNPVVTEQYFAELLAQYPDIPHFQTDNGIKIPAAWLISTAGLKGLQIGGARVYDKQPLVIVNTGDATAGDIVELAQVVQQTIKQKFGIQISPEVNYV